MPFHHGPKLTLVRPPAPTLGPLVAFPFVSTPGTNVGATQSVAKTDAYFWTSSTVGAAQKTILTYPRNYDGTFGTLLHTYDTTADNAAAHTQVNGLFYRAGNLFVGANNFSTTPALGWIYEYAVASDGSLTFVAAHSVGAFWCEGATWHAGFWWVFSHDVWGIDKYDASWNLITQFTFPGVSPEYDTLKNLLNGAAWRGDYLYTGLHGSNINAPRLDRHRFTGAAFVEPTHFYPPTDDTTQGFFFDANGKEVWWAERVNNLAGSGSANVVVSSFTDLPEVFPNGSSSLDGASGSAPSGWTARWVTTGVTWAENAGGFLRASVTTVARHALSWDTPGNAIDLEVMVKLRSSELTVAGAYGGIIVRASGAAAAETGYRVMLGNTGLVFGRYVGGASTSTTTVAVGAVANTYYWIRFRMHGSSVRVRFWEDGDPEPDTWIIGGRDTNITGTGWFGVIANAVADVDFDYISYALNGGTAP